MSPVVTSKFVRECKEKLNKIGRANQVILVCIPGRTGVEGNEKTDEMARFGSSVVA